jgi:SAM-dependent methyltransferase
MTEPPMDAKRIVADGYDRMAERYLEWSAVRPSATRARALALAEDLIPAGADVLDLGCGAGLPMTAALATGRRVTGVDISGEQIRLARRNVPSATFVEADLATLEWPAASVDAVVAFYALTHIPREELGGLLGRILSWLRPNGVLIASFGVDDAPGAIEPDWLGVDMYFSHFSEAVNRRMVADAGFVVERAEVLDEPGDGDTRFLWIVGRAPAAQAAGDAP